ncbi:hypothetical protein NCCP1664_15310 [Zafaria cholistanensis]|uniref:histidine kinase n=1 Tax=Zafaria cholistanensis TaxID=1682741 RepID=A0A5A7NQL7_9MICC|nr:sensor histidine kinase [Zafaria cholistanensis]GER23035.1 hypothetical protein NCCP1664_15310 [Zafaria cholistanensis]
MTPAPQQETPEIPDVSFAELSAQRQGPLRRFMRGRPIAVDAAVCLLYLLLSAAGPVQGLQRGDWIPASLTLAAAGLLFLRRRYPMAVLAGVAVLETAAMAAQPLDSKNGVGLWIALYSAATQYSGKRMFMLAGLISGVQTLAMAVVLPSAALHPLPGQELAAATIAEDPAIVWLGAALMAALNLGAVALGAWVRNSRLHEAELANWANRVRTLAQASERNRIAREMHDVVAHSLSVMVALSDGAAVVIKRDPERAAEVLRELSSTGRGALADMRRVIGVLRAGPDAPLQPQPAAGSLKEMLDGFRVAGVPLKFGRTGPDLPEDASFQLTVYRIIQESLTNVLRYGRGVSRVEVLIARDGDTVRIRVADNGQLAGAAREAVGSGQGLRGIAERAAIFGGSSYAGPGPQGGWVVHVILTVPEDPDPGPAGGTTAAGPASTGPARVSTGIPPDSTRTTATGTNAPGTNATNTTTRGEVRHGPRNDV